MITLFTGWCYDWYIFPHFYAPILFLNENENLEECHTTITVFHTEFRSAAAKRGSYIAMGKCDFL